MDLNKEQFIDLIIALEHRSVTLRLELIHALLPTEEQLPAEALAEIERFEQMKAAVYTSAAAAGFSGELVENPETKRWVVRPDSELEGLVLESIDDMEEAVTTESIIEQKSAELMRELRSREGEDELPPEVLAASVDALTTSYLSYIAKNGLSDLIADLVPEGETN